VVVAAGELLREVDGEETIMMDVDCWLFLLLLLVDLNRKEEGVDLKQIDRKEDVGSKCENVETWNCHFWRYLFRTLNPSHEKLSTCKNNGRRGNVETSKLQVEKYLFKTGLTRVVNNSRIIIFRSARFVIFAFVCLRVECVIFLQKERVNYSTKIIF
jgi:hypothetical protein